MHGHAGECGVWSVCRVAYVCQCTGWLADSLTDSKQTVPLRELIMKVVGYGRCSTATPRVPALGTVATIGAIVLAD